MKSDRLNQSKKAMKKSLRYLCMTALALMGAVIMGCSSDENSIEEPKQPENDKVVTLTATVSMDGSATTRALTPEGVKTFAEGDVMALIYNNTNDETMKAVGTIIAGAGTSSATFTFTLTDPKKEGDVTYIYPAAMAGETDVDYTRLNSQEGTLDDLGRKYDLCTNSGSWDNGALPTLMLENRLAICAYTIKNSDGTSDMTGSVTDMTISDGTNIYTVSRSAAAGPIYVAIRPTSGADISYTATAGDNVYEKSVTAKTYEAGNLYPLGLKMTKVDVCSSASSPSTKAVTRCASRRATCRRFVLQQTTTAIRRSPGRGSVPPTSGTSWATPLPTTPSTAMALCQLLAPSISSAG